jgi:error-prone DNA polymerase
MTLEDETGFVNLVVWRQVSTRYADVLRSASLLGVTGRLQVQDRIVHLIADHLWIPQLSRELLAVESRDFH